MDAWVLAGQSNMEGRGLRNDPRARQPSVAEVHNFTSAGRWELAADPLHRLWESFTPVHVEILRNDLTNPADRDLSDAQLARRERQEGRSGAGLGIAFGRTMAAGTGRSVGLIPTAHGGTTLQQWSPEDAPLGTRSLYGSMLERIRAACTSPDVVLAGVLWYQGESDGTTTRAPSYGERFAAWIAAVRRDLGKPDLPIYVVQLGRFISTDVRDKKSDPNKSAAAWDIIRDAQRTLPEVVPGTGVVSAIDLALADAIHLDAPSLVRLGRRLARVALKQTTGPAISSLTTLPLTDNDLPRVRLKTEHVDSRWTPTSRIPGFAAFDDQGRSHPNQAVVDVRPLDDDPRDLEIVLSDPLEPGTRIGYGLGFDPPCTVLDASDMTLPAFLPQPIDG